LTNNGSTTTKSAVSGLDLSRAGLLSITFNHTTNNATVHQHSQLKSTFVGGATANYRFDNRLFGLFGRALTTDPATKTGTASNKAKQNFEVAEFMLYDRVLTDNERLEVQGYFLDKYTVI
jgi:hypothetical protein